MLEPSSGSEEAWLGGMGSPERYHLQSEAVHQSMACMECLEAGDRQAHMLDKMWLKETRQRQRTCRGSSAAIGRPCRARTWACVRCKGVMCREHCRRHCVFWYRAQKERMGGVKTMLTPWRGPAGKGGRIWAALLSRC